MSIHTMLSRRTYRGGPSTRAFTLIELLLVLVILTVLAAVVVPRFGDCAKQAKITAAKTDISSLGTALSSFQLDNDRFPTTEEGLRALMEQPTNAPGWNHPYLEKAITKDPWDNPYIYQCPGTNRPDSYDLHSFGPDGREGGGDDIDNWTEK